MTWERVEKLIGSDNLKRLANKRVGVIGVGSGGGFVALSLAMSGVGKFVLIDNDILEEGNIVRHVADRRYIGQPKVDAVAELIRYRNPEAEVDARNSRFEDELDVLKDLDILVVGVDNENAKYVINQACLQHNLTAVYAGVYERGEGGDVVVITPYEGPCYACWSEQLREGMTEAPPEGDLDYGMIGEQGTLDAEPGLWLHVAKVAAIQTDLVLNELLIDSDISENMPANTIIIANNSLEIVDGEINDPHTGIWIDIQRDPECLVCGDKFRLTAQASQGISLDELEDIMMGEEDALSQAEQDN